MIATTAAMIFQKASWTRCSATLAPTTAAVIIGERLLQSYHPSKDRTYHHKVVRRDDAGPFWTLVRAPPLLLLPVAFLVNQSTQAGLQPLRCHLRLVRSTHRVTPVATPMVLPNVDEGLRPCSWLKTFLAGIRSWTMRLMM